MSTTEQFELAAEVLAFAGSLADQSEFALAVLAEHLEKWDGEFYPHLWMSDIGKKFQVIHPINEEMRIILKILDDELASGRPRARGLVRTGFIEKLDFTRPETQEFVADFPNLQSYFRRHFGL